MPWPKIIECASNGDWFTMLDLSYKTSLGNEPWYPGNLTRDIQRKNPRRTLDVTKRLKWFLCIHLLAETNFQDKIQHHLVMNLHTPWIWFYLLECLIVLRRFHHQLRLKKLFFESKNLVYEFDCFWANRRYWIIWIKYHYQCQWNYFMTLSNLP